MKKLKAISWSGGTQSTAMVVMSALEDLPIDVVITADTHWESQRTYEIIDFYTQWLRSRNVQVEVVTAGSVKQQGAIEHIHVPFWTADGGPFRKQCTNHFKVVPIKRRLRELAGYHATEAPHPPAGRIEVWLGITIDEFTRMSPSRVQFIEHRWPLVERRLSRIDCIDYLSHRDLPVPPKSACLGCPFRSASEWLEVQENSMDDWKRAVAFDESNRHNPLARREGDTADELYVYKGGPLGEADLEKDAKHKREGKQLPLMVCESGYCMV